MIALIVFLSTSLSVTNASPPTVASVDLKSYVGLWYEIRRIENDFQDVEPTLGEGACFNTQAEYSILPSGKINVKNSCFRKSTTEVANGKAYAVEGSNNSKLKVNFTGNSLLEWLGIGDGDYWILALGPQNSAGLYTWVLVGAPNLDYGWILAREPKLGANEIETALSVAESVGYNRNVFKSFRR